MSSQSYYLTAKITQLSAVKLNTKIFFTEFFKKDTKTHSKSFSPEYQQNTVDNLRATKDYQHKWEKR